MSFCDCFSSNFYCFIFWITDTLHIAVNPYLCVAVIVAVPFAFAVIVTAPFVVFSLLTLTIFEFDDFQVTSFEDVFVGLNISVSFSELPLFIVVVFLLKLMLFGGMYPIIVNVNFFPLSFWVAVILAVPNPATYTFPVWLIVATFVLSELHVIVLYVALDGVTVTDNCVVFPFSNCLHIFCDVVNFVAFIAKILNFFVIVPV